ncbi:MAG: hypothetical protein KTR15_04605 [Phycisphaeraceae bacterium]|nr:hypothetical protein [Phycisphaeraceae bacterium]
MPTTRQLKTALLLAFIGYNAQAKNTKPGLITPEDQALWERGASNAGYHYLGCGKTMAQIGEAFAKALLQEK